MAACSLNTAKVEAMDDESDAGSDYEEFSDNFVFVVRLKIENMFAVSLQIANNNFSINQLSYRIVQHVGFVMVIMDQVLAIQYAVLAIVFYFQLLMNH